MRFERSRRFKREFNAKPPRMRDAIVRTMKRVAEGDQAHGLWVKPMGGYENVWEARIDGGNRLTFERGDGVIRFRANCNHDILRRP